MKPLKLTWISFVLLSSGIAACAQHQNTASLKQDTTMEQFEIRKSDEEWRSLLTPVQFNILRLKGTERPFTGEYDEFFDEGTYFCAACGAELFKSRTKYNSGCGWPAFYEPSKNNNIKEQRDLSHGMVRIEVMCARCGGHLGHVFPDGPKPTGLRYCINSGALRFESAEK